MTAAELKAWSEKMLHTHSEVLDYSEGSPPFRTTMYCHCDNCALARAYLKLLEAGDKIAESMEAAAKKLREGHPGRPVSRMGIVEFLESRAAAHRAAKEGK